LYDCQSYNDRSSPEHSYRPDIDGLRTVAVGAVIIFHFFPDWLSGGFVGVDMFFVISGYLISEIISRRVQAGTFSYAEFYQKRVRRIFPTMLPVLSATLVGGYFCLAQRQFEWLGGSLFAGCGFAANVFFHVAGETPDAMAIANFGGGYMQAVETDGPPNPLLHLWSLGVEEQFYILWPLVVPSILRRKESHRAQAAIYLVMFVASMTIGLVYGFTGKQRPGFYLVFSRFWELLIGCFLSWTENELGYRAEHLSQNAAEITAVLGSLSIAISLAVIDHAVVWPGWAALFPTCGTAAVIFAGKQTKLNRLLYGNRVFAYTGRISYPLYLWHWPVFAYGKIISESHRSRDNPAPPLAYETGWCPCDALECFPVGTRLCLIAATVLLSMATLQFVEKPVRHHKSERTPYFLSAGVFFLFCLGIIVFTGAIKSADEAEYEASPQSVWGSAYQVPAASASQKPFNMLDECLEKVTVERLKDMKTTTIAEWNRMFQDGVINPGRDEHVLVWGDSHAVHLLPRVHYLASLDSVRERMPTVTTMVGGSVAPFPPTMGDVEYWNPPTSSYTVFDTTERWSEVTDYLASHEGRVSAVVLSSFWEVEVGLMLSINGGTPFAWPRTLAELADRRSWPAVTNTTVKRWRDMIEELGANGTRSVYVVKPSVGYREPWHFGQQLDCDNSPQFTGEPSFTNVGESDRCSCCGKPGDSSGRRVCSLSSMIAGNYNLQDSYHLVENAAPHVQPLSSALYYNATGFIATPLLDAAVAAGAVLLDPSDSMCHNGYCPVLDPAGYRAFLDSDHYRPGFIREYGSFLDVAFNVHGIAPRPTEYCLP
jgi:peptidoglycan/LPS O-acetylase OafA/YrhL